MLNVVKQCLDVFHVFANTRRHRLLGNTPEIKPRTEDDWEADDLSAASSGGLLSAVTPQQKALPIIHCELSLICECFSCLFCILLSHFLLQLIFTISITDTL